jgi:N6-L-threonylcarbamoyladenine synthase
MLNRISRYPVAIPGPEANDLCASFQEAVCDVLAAKTTAALQETGVKRLVVAGGVACNSGLRNRMQTLAANLGIDLRIPAPALCGDNAAMLAVPGDYYLEHGFASPQTLDVTATWDMDRVGEVFS